MRAFGGTVVLCALLAGGADLRADGVPPASAAPSPQQEALQLYRQAAAAYTSGDYRGALDKFERSYARYASSSTMFNIGQCHRQLGDPASAARAYRAYLELKPDASDAATVRSLIAQQEELAQARAAAPPSLAPPVEPPPTARPALLDSRAGQPLHAEERSNRRGLLVGVTFGATLLVGIALGVGLGVGLERRGPRSELGLVRPEFP